MKIAAETYVCGRALPVDENLPRIASAMAEMGYDGYECFAKSMEVLRRADTRPPLACSGLHLCALELEDLDRLRANLDYAGTRNICLSGLLAWDERSAADYRAAAQRYNEVGRNLRAEGIHVCYHNHDFEFKVVDGQQTGMQLLLAELDPAGVELCVDTGWISYAGHDAVPFLREQAARIRILHLRDFAGRNSVELGQGDLDLGTVVGQITSLPALEWLVVEQDPGPVDPLASMKVSRDYLRSEFGL